MWVIILVLFIEKTALSLLNCFDTFVNYQWIINVRFYYRILNVGSTDLCLSLCQYHILLISIGLGQWFSLRLLLPYFPQETFGNIRRCFWLSWLWGRGSAAGISGGNVRGRGSIYWLLSPRPPPPNNSSLLSLFVYLIFFYWKMDILRVPGWLGQLSTQPLISAQMRISGLWDRSPNQALRSAWSWLVPPALLLSPTSVPPPSND